MEEPIRSEKELLDMHTDTQTRTHFQEKGAKETKLFVVEKGTGVGREKRKKTVREEGRGLSCIKQELKTLPLSCYPIPLMGPKG